MVPRMKLFFRTNPRSSLRYTRQTHTSGPLLLFFRLIVPLSCCVRFKKLSSLKRARMTILNLHENSCVMLAQKLESASAFEARCLSDAQGYPLPGPSSLLSRDSFEETWPPPQASRMVLCLLLRSQYCSISRNP